MSRCLLLAPLLGVLLFATPASAAWYHLPTVDFIRPVGWNHAARYHALFAERVAGPHASYLYREPLARLHAHYALLDQTGQGIEISSKDADQYEYLVGMGAGMALESWLLETVERSPGMSWSFRVVRTAVSPRLDLEQGEDGWSGELNSGELAGRSRFRLREEAAGLGRNTRDRPRITVLGGLKTYEVQGRLGETHTRVGATLTARAENTVIDYIIANYRVVKGSWDLAFRQRIHPILGSSLLFTSQDSGPLPRSWGVGLNLRAFRSAAWSLYTRYRRPFPFPPSKAESWRVETVLRFLPQNPVPVNDRRWPLGHRPGYPGPYYPDLARGLPLATRMHVGMETPEELLDLPEGDVRVVEHVGVGGLFADP